MRPLAEKAGGALRYALIGAQEPRKIGRRSARRQEPYREIRREPGRIFKVIFQGVFLGDFFRHVLGVL